MTRRKADKSALKTASDTAPYRSLWDKTAESKPWGSVKVHLSPDLVARSILRFRDRHTSCNTDEYGILTRAADILRDCDDKENDT